MEDEEEIGDQDEDSIESKANKLWVDINNNMAAA